MKAAKITKVGGIFLTACAAIAIMPSAARAEVAALIHFSIQSQDLGTALTRLAQQSKREIYFSSDLTRGRRAPAVTGDLAVNEALDRLLRGSGLAYHIDASGAITIASAEGNAGAAAMAAQNTGSDEPAIIVTAQKRSEAAQNVPMGLTVLQGEQLAKSQSFRLQDFAGNLPGLTFTTVQGGALEIESRGLTVGSDLGSMTAIYLDETPIQTAGVPADYSNFDTYDMARIEFLKGPQGTLYGANAAAGLLKYVTNAPDPSGFRASLQAGLSGVYRGSQIGSDLHGMVNVPLSDNSALRLVGYNVYYPGFTDDLTLGARDINWARSVGGRGSLLWRPSNKLSIRFSALYHRQEAGDFEYGTEDVYAGTLVPVYGPLIQRRLETRQPAFSSTSIESLTVNWDLGFANLLSESSLYNLNQGSTEDISAYLTSLSTLFFSKVYGISAHIRLNSSTISQEVRISSKDTAELQWIVGGYLLHQRTRSDLQLCPVDLGSHLDNCTLPTDPNTFLGTGSPLGGTRSKRNYWEAAAFGNTDYHFTSKFDISVGARYSSVTQNESPTTLVGPIGPFFGGFDGSTVREGVFGYSADARWRPSKSTMVYARVASGYQPGGPNEPGPGVPPSYKSSTTTDYEFGVKTILPEVHLTGDMAVYHIKWRDIGVFVQGIGFQSYIANAASAYSNGVELQLNFAPTRGLTIVASGSYNHAYIAALGSNAEIGARVGDRLPLVPLWQGAIDLNYKRHVFGSLSGFISASWNYNSNRLELFSSNRLSFFRPVLPAHGIINLGAGLESARYSLSAYVKNVTNSLTPNSLMQNATTGWNGPLSSQGLLPRTFGVTLGAKF